MTTSETAVAPLTLSFMSANYVAAELGYGAADDWGPFDEATNAAFAPIETFAERFDAVLATISGAGFDALDLWTAHLNWRWATPEHVGLARAALERHGLRVVSLAGNFGSTADELDAACRLADRARTSTCSAGWARCCAPIPPAAAAVLRAHGVRFGYENHPEHDPSQVLELIGDDADVLGATVDTGWWATHGYDAVRCDQRAPRAALPRPPEGRRATRRARHVPARHGCVDIDGCVDALVALGLRRRAVASSTSPTTGIPRPNAS